MSQANGVGPRVSKRERERARKEAREEQRRQQDEQTARSLAQGAVTQQGTAAPGYWDMLGDPDLDHPDWGDKIGAFTKGALARPFALGNITAKEKENLDLRIENEFWQIQNEMLGPNSSLDDDDMRLLYGEERPRLDDSQARRLREAREVKKMLISLSKDARGLRSGTEIHAVARTEDSNPEDEDTGRFSSLRGYLGR